MELDLDAFGGLAAPDALACGEAVDRDHENVGFRAGEQMCAQPRSRVGRRVAGTHSKGECPARKEKYLPVGTLVVRGKTLSRDTGSAKGQLDRFHGFGSMLGANRDGDSPFAVQLSSC